MSTTQTQRTTAGTYAGPLPTSRPARRTVDAGAPGATAGERLRAQAGLVVLWAALAVAILTYAIVTDSAGALLLAGIVTWLLRVSWTLTLRPRSGDHATPIHFD